MGTFFKVKKRSEVPEGGSALVVAGGTEIALFNVRGRIHATANACVHQGAPLVEGELEGTTVTCPWHSWTFDVTTGRSLLNPSACLRTYKVRVEGDDILIEL